MGQDDQDRKGPDSGEIAGDDAFEALRSLDIRTERRLFWRELVILAITALLASAYIVALLIRHGVVPMPLQ